MSQTDACVLLHFCRELTTMPYKTKGIRAQWNELTMKRAVGAVICSKKSVKGVSKEYGLPLETLRRKVILARKGSGVEKRLGRSPVLSETAEAELSQMLRDMESRLYGLTPVDVRRIVFKYAEKNGIAHNFNKETQMAGRYWLEGFLRRHQELSVRQAEAVSIQRAIGFNKPKVDKFYDILKSLLFSESGQQLIPAGNIYNVDESGFTICQTPSKIIAAKGKHSIGQLTSAEKGKNVTVVCCMSAAGHFVPPLFIFPRARLKPSLMDHVPAGAVGAANKTGWITESIFTQWFSHFLNVVQPQSRAEPVLLLMDGHTTHTGNLDVIDQAAANNVKLLVFPSHCTHRLQPLDLSFFKSLNGYYNTEIVAWLRSHPGRRVTEDEIGGLFASAYGKAASVNNATRGFEKAGIHPFRDDLFSEEDFAGRINEAYCYN